MNKQIVFNSLSYFTSTNIPADSLMVKIGLIASGVIFLIGLVLPLIIIILRRNFSSAMERLLKRAGILLKIAGLIWLILFFLRFEAITPFNRRIWVYSLAPIFSIELVRIYLKYRKLVPLDIQDNEWQKRFVQYLPKTKISDNRLNNKPVSRFRRNMVGTSTKASMPERH